MIPIIIKINPIYYFFLLIKPPTKKPIAPKIIQPFDAPPLPAIPKLEPIIIPIIPPIIQPILNPIFTAYQII